MEITYGWKIGSRIKGDAEKASKELETIGEQITPRLLLSYASKHEKSELHKQFEWNDERAGHLYRLRQAQHLMACIIVEKETITPKGEKQIIITRAYENVKVNGNEEEAEDRVYVPIDTALTVPKYREYVINGIRKSIQDLQEKARIYNSYFKNAAQFSGGLDTALKSI